MYILLYIYIYIYAFFFREYQNLRSISNKIHPSRLNLRFSSTITVNQHELDLFKFRHIRGENSWKFRVARSIILKCKITDKGALSIYLATARINQIIRGERRSGEEKGEGTRRKAVREEHRETFKTGLRNPLDLVYFRRCRCHARSVTVALNQQHELSRGLRSRKTIYVTWAGRQWLRTVIDGGRATPLHQR